ncbi:MAG: 50S ribosomal protein L25/general stress protein Ctc [Deltaproteobacteria bacterium]|nr:50S ribosomal protein L25/general stress protein Ctc [Deltaproteobacteria bacterium]
MARYTLAAKVRNEKGKQAAKKFRRENRIPAIFYGHGAASLMLTVDEHELDMIMKKKTGENVIIGLEIESDKGADTRTVILKEMHSDPVKADYLHVDFYEISMDKELTVDIALHFVNTAKGVTNGGMLQPIRRELTVSCLPDKIVDFIAVDVSELEIGQSLHVKDITLPDGIKAVQDPELTMVTVMAPTIVAAEPTAVEEEGKEGEEGKEASAAEA